MYNQSVTQNDITLGDLVQVSNNDPIFVVEVETSDNGFRIEGFDNDGEYQTVFVDPSVSVTIWE